MTEPAEIAELAEEVVPGIFHWRIHNSNIGGSISSSHALVDAGVCVFIDPVRLAAPALVGLPAPAAILLTATCHQRSAWRYRSEFGAQVWLPEGAPSAEQEPDKRYEENQRLPGGLLALRTPGPEWPHFSFLREGSPGVLFCSDLISHDGAGNLHFVAPEYHEDPVATRRSVEGLLELPFSVLCLDHGAPLTDDPKEAIRRLLDSTS